MIIRGLESRPAGPASGGAVAVKVMIDGAMFVRVGAGSGTGVVVTPFNVYSGL